MSAPIFTTQTFDLLEAIARVPTAAFYIQNKAAFQQHVEKPLQGLMRAAAGRLPGTLRARMETERGVFSRFIKNDFGRGGAWANYWGAFYPKCSRRIMDAQLAVWLDRQRVGISFYINDYGRLPRERFQRSCAAYRRLLPDLLAHLVTNPRIQLARGGRTHLDEAGFLVPDQPMTWAEWFADPSAADDWAFVPLRPADVIAMPGEALIDLTARLHADFFPLVLLSQEEDPLPLIEAYLGG